MFSRTRLPAEAAALDPNDPAFGFILRALTDLMDYGFAPDDPDIICRAVERGRKNYTARADHLHRLDAEAARPTIPAEGDVVYYARIGNRCKIGYTGNLQSRMASVNPEELLATEPGTVSLERQRHSEFARLRTHGEWFRLTEPLTSHIERIRAAS